MKHKPEAVKMTKVDFINLVRRYGYTTTTSGLSSLVAKKRNSWIFADESWVNSEKVTNFQVFSSSFPGYNGDKLTYVWQLRIFLKTHME